MTFKPFIGLNAEGLLVFDDSSCMNSSFVYLVHFAVLSGMVKSSHDRNGHVGHDKLLYIVSQVIFHPGLNRVVTDVIKSCQHCLLHKSYSSPVSPPILNIKADFPFQLVQADTMNLSHSTRGYKYVLNVVDQHSKYGLLPNLLRIRLHCHVLKHLAKSS